MELSDELVLLCYSLIGCGFNCFVDADTIVFVINPPMVPSAAVQVFCEVNRGVYVAAVTTLDKVVSAAQSDEDSSPGGFLVQFAGSHLRVSGSLNSAADWSSLSQLLFATVWEYCTIASTVVADPNQR